jgi:hypothetical protein
MRPYLLQEDDVGRQARSGLLGMAALTAAALIAAGCGSGGSNSQNSSAGGSNSNSAANAAKGPGGAGSKSITNYLANGLKQLGITDAKKIVSAPLCLNGQVAAGLGGDYPIWTYAIASSLFGAPTDPGMPAYEKVAKTYSTPADAPDPWNIVAFSQILTTVRFMNEIGYGHITPKAMLAKAKAFTGPVALGAPSLACGQNPSAPAVCNDRTQFFQYRGKHVFVKVAGWLQPRHEAAHRGPAPPGPRLIRRGGPCNRSCCSSCSGSAPARWSPPSPSAWW